jgi:hypothetical protein
VLAAVVLLTALLSGTPAQAAQVAADDPAIPSTVPLPVVREPTVRGVLRFGRTLRVRPARFAVPPSQVTYRWLRDGEPVAGAEDPTYAVQPADVGARLGVLVTATAPGYADTQVTSARRAEVRHRRDARRTVTYHVETRGRTTASLREFAAQARQTYADPRGWRGAGVAFRQVPRRGAFTLVLAEASEVPRFSSGCSAAYSCRVGRYVVINQTRWLRATPPWTAAGGSLRDYRHLVVDHETGHWLGLGHAGCSRPGGPAPVMMQQSKGLDGCLFNPFPTLAELARV